MIRVGDQRAAPADALHLPGGPQRPPGGRRAASCSTANSRCGFALGVVRHRPAARHRPGPDLLQLLRRRQRGGPLRRGARARRHRSSHRRHGRPAVVPDASNAFQPATRYAARRVHHEVRAQRQLAHDCCSRATSAAAGQREHHGGYGYTGDIARRRRRHGVHDRARRARPTSRSRRARTTPTFGGNNVPDAFFAKRRAARDAAVRHVPGRHGHRRRLGHRAGARRGRVRLRAHRLGRGHRTVAGHEQRLRPGHGRRQRRVRRPVHARPARSTTSPSSAATAARPPSTTAPSPSMPRDSSTWRRHQPARTTSSRPTASTRRWAPLSTPGSSSSSITTLVGAAQADSTRPTSAAPTDSSGPTAWPRPTPVWPTSSVKPAPRRDSRSRTPLQPTYVGGNRDAYRR